MIQFLFSYEMKWCVLTMIVESDNVDDDCGDDNVVISFDLWW